MEIDTTNKAEQWTNKKMIKHSTNKTEDMKSLQSQTLRFLEHLTPKVLNALQTIAFYYWRLFILTNQCAVGRPLKLNNNNKRETKISTVSENETVSTPEAVQTLTVNTSRRQEGHDKVSHVESVVDWEECETAVTSSCRGSGSYEVLNTESFLFARKQQRQKVYQHIAKALRLDIENHKGNYSHWIVFNSTLDYYTLHSS